MRITQWEGWGGAADKKVGTIFGTARRRKYSAEKATKISPGIFCTDAVFICVKLQANQPLCPSEPNFILLLKGTLQNWFC